MGKSTLLALKLSQQPRFVLYDTLTESTYERFQRVTDFDTLCNEIQKDTFRIAYHGIEGLTIEEDFDFCCRLIYAQGNMTFSVDEIDLHCSPTSMPQSLENIVSIGRHRNIDFYCASRRPYAIHPLIRSQANRIYSFNQTEPRDLDWCAQVMSSDLIERLPLLARYNHIEWNDSDLSSPGMEEPHNNQALTEQEG